MEENKELSHILNTYLESKSYLSLNSLAQNMKVPETSLRRIKKAELKRLPKNETILKVLSHIYRTSDLYEIREALGEGSLSEYLSNEFLLSSDSSKIDIKVIDESVSDQTSYLVFKLASNSCGTTISEVQRLFGQMGLSALENLKRDDLVKVDGDNISSNLNTFKVSNEYFVRNFKAVSDFIKVEGNTEMPNLFYNLSESVNRDAAKKIHKVQKNALKEIISILNDEQSRGDIPLFVLSAIDSLK
ncbi:hypothetical protein BIY24_09600 [Halobacteriovorax marinus]|uniref:hypothetical protein n=1 Tax=Halobacteriovorax marinus TaxID=97084 RepID=UPI000BC35B6C|nr:hypothetical protein [Halobacteriovorax marinus]ATH08194.1 hypothetical protein BIY24_09600 [Halobacteriovorax marinus]